MSSNVLECWNIIREKSAELRKRNSNANGLEFYIVMRNISQNIQTRENVSVSWNQKLIKNDGDLYIEFKQYLDDYPEKDNDGNMIETNHFLHQHFNIPNKDEPFFFRFLQIALNGGQLEPNFNSNNYDPELIKLYYKSEFHKPETFIMEYDNFDVSDDFVEKFEKDVNDAVDRYANIIVNEQNGGYYEKYVKYKNKYIKSKKF